MKSCIAGGDINFINYDLLTTKDQSNKLWLFNQIKLIHNYVICFHFKFTLKYLYELQSKV